MYSGKGAALEMVWDTLEVYKERPRRMGDILARLALSFIRARRYLANGVTRRACYILSVFSRD